MPQEAILSFWFGENAEDVEERVIFQWFKADPAFDRTLAQRFGKLQKAAVSGSFEGWTRTARGRLALILLLDQLSRNLHRESPRAFEQDERCQVLSLEGVELGQDKELALFERLFLYMPLMHSEKLLHQTISLRLYEALLAGAHEGAKSRMARSLEAAQRHHDVVAAHGRFPHRNAVLGRVSSAEELRYLAARAPGSFL
jgi:uncharacterized protein (DUF924 family)